MSRVVQYSFKELSQIWNTFKLCAHEQTLLFYQSQVCFRGSQGHEHMRTTLLNKSAKFCIDRYKNDITGSISRSAQLCARQHFRAFTHKPWLGFTPNPSGTLISLPPSDMPHESLGGCWGCGVCVGCEYPLRLLAVLILHCMYMHDVLLNYLKLYDLSCLPKERYNLFDPFI